MFIAAALLTLRRSLAGAQVQQGNEAVAVHNKIHIALEQQK